MRLIPHIYQRAAFPQLGDPRCIAQQVSLNGLRASFLPPAEKARLEAKFRAEFARLRES